MLRSKTLPGSSLRARSLTAPPHPTLPPIPAARDLARRLDPPSLSPSLPPSLLFPSLPLPLPSLRPLPTYLSTYPLYLPSTYLPIYLCIYLSIYLPLYLSTYPPPACPTHPALPPARPRAGVPTPASHTLPKAFFLPSPRPKPSQIQGGLFFFFFSFFMLIRRDSNPTPLCLPINYQFNAYANCAPPWPKNCACHSMERTWRGRTRGVGDKGSFVFDWVWRCARAGTNASSKPW